MIFRQAKAEDVAAVAALQRHIQQRLADPEMLVCDDEAFFAEIVSRTGRIALAEDDGKLAGCSVIYFPGATSEDNLGRFLDVPEQNLGSVAHLDSAFFLPEYRGRGLAGALGRENIAAVRAQGAELILATASPCNLSSLRNLFSLDFHIRALTELYGGRMRFILARPADARPTVAQPVELEVSCTDLAGHKRALDAGRWGTDLRRDGSGAVILYAAGLELR